MVARRGLVPALIVAIFVVAACAVSLAHVEPGGIQTCIAAKAESKSAPTLPADLAAPVVATIDLTVPSAAARPAVPGPPSGFARQALAGPDVPRAPPA